MRLGPGRFESQILITNVLRVPIREERNLKLKSILRQLADLAKAGKQLRRTHVTRLAIHHH